MRYCTKCGGQNTGKHKSWCRTCLNILCAQYQSLVMDEMFVTYGDACACCGIVRRTFLELDHVNNDGTPDRMALGTPGKAGFPFVTKLRRLGWPTGYQLLCANCHSEKTKLGRCACQKVVASAN